METTTIEVTAEQRDYLKGMAMGSHKSALQELIDSYESGPNASQRDADISETLESIEERLRENESVSGVQMVDSHIESELEELRRQIDELQHELPRKVAEELR